MSNALHSLIKLRKQNESRGDTVGGSGEVFVE